MKEKRITIKVDEILHKEIKVRAAYKNITITAWVLRAIADAIKKEDSYNEQ